MKFSKIGLSVSIISMLAFVLGYLSIWYAVVFLGVVFIVKLDYEVKINALQSTLLALVFMVLEGGVSISNGGYLKVINFFQQSILRGKNMEVLYKLNLFPLLLSFIGLIQILVILYCIFKARTGEIVELPVITGIAKKHVQEESSGL